VNKTLIGALVAAGLASVTLAPTASATPYYDEDTVAQFVAAVNSEAARYNTGHVPVYVDYLPDNLVMAQTDGNGVITINSQWAALPPERFNALVAEDVAAGYQPGGCAGIQAVAIHEMGHVIDRLGGRAARSAVSAHAYEIDGNDLHGYAFDGGSLNPGEAVAVSFQAVECGSATNIERHVYDVLVSN
jgi:hypothetical protein